MASERAKHALVMRRAGATYRNIAYELGVTQVRARKLSLRALFDEARAAGLTRRDAHQLAMTILRQTSRTKHTTAARCLLPALHAPKRLRRFPNRAEA